MKISLIFGTRPEAIKLCPLVLKLREQPGVTTHVCVTAQHREMLDQVLDSFGVKPDVDLDLMSPNQNLSGLTAQTLTALGEYLREHRPDVVIVQSDTTTAFCAALAAFYEGIPVGHVEAGLRTCDKRSPFPEEANRVLTSYLTAYHFAPTETSRGNLLAEGIPDRDVFVTGNTVVDALFLSMEKVRRMSMDELGLPEAVQTVLRDPTRRLVLITGHRRESFGAGFQGICRGVDLLARAFPDVDFVYPVHPNPNVRELVHELLSERRNVHLIAPLPYRGFLALMDRCTLVLSDSGGVQEEVPCLGKPVLVMRDTTERPEAVETGNVRLVGTDAEHIRRAVAELLNDPKAYNRMTKAANPYGDGRACERIIEALQSAERGQRSSAV